MAKVLSTRAVIGASVIGIEYAREMST